MTLRIKVSTVGLYMEEREQKDWTLPFKNFSKFCVSAASLLTGSKVEAKCLTLYSFQP